MPRVKAHNPNQVIVKLKSSNEDRRSEAANIDYEIIQKLHHKGPCCKKECWRLINNQMGSQGDGDYMPILSLINETMKTVKLFTRKEKHNYMMNLIFSSIIRTEQMTVINFILILFWILFNSYLSLLISYREAVLKRMSKDTFMIFRYP